ncbi:MAG: hypothetical protein HWE12_12720 [Oceanospirillaceae bacterium]|nr:hypothetical protein [Oceanospirillaceae bacterium]
MPNSTIEQLLAKLKIRGDEISSRTPLTIAVSEDDLVRIEALSRLYKLPMEELSAQLMSEILQQVEARIPYKPGPKVIRVEDEEPIYEDIGDMPRYLEIKRSIEGKSKH